MRTVFCPADWRVWLILLAAGLGGLPGAGWGASVEKAAAPECDPPFVYSPIRVMEARDTAGRAQWTELMIDAGAGDLTRPENQIQAACLKAVLFGGEERLAQAVQTFTDILGKWIEAGPAGEPLSPRVVIQLAQSLDWLSALPEWLKTGLPERQALRDRFAELVNPLMSSAPDGLADDVQYHLQAAKLYAGLIAGATGLVQESLLGNGKLPGLEAAARQALTSEGLLAAGTPRRHAETGRDFLLAGAALKSCSPEAYAALEPLMQKTVTVLEALAYPSSRFPAVLAREKTGGQELVQLLEIGYALFPRPNLRNLLVELYKTNPRRPESLLFSEPSLLAGGPPEVVYSDALPQTGAALIHDVSDKLPLSLYLDTGLSGRTGPSALLSVEWMGLPAPPGSAREDSHTADFNTVVVDRMSQPATPESLDAPRNALLGSWKSFEDGTTYVKAVADGQYTERAAYPAGVPKTPVTAYERTVYLSSPFAVDLFRVRGGQAHDWIYHSPAPLESLAGGEWVDYQADAEDYAFVRDAANSLRAASPQGVYGLVYKPVGEKPQRERVWFIDPVGSQLITGNEGGGSFVIARREMEGDEGDLYAVFHEWSAGGAAPDIEITQLALDPPPNRRGFQAVAFTVRSGSETHIFLSATNPEVTYTADYHNKRIVFQGGLGYIHLQNDAFASMRLLDGANLRYDTHGLNFATPLSVGVARRVNEAESWVELDIPGLLPFGPAMQNTSLLVLSNDPAPVMYQPLMIERIDPGEPPQKARLLHTPNLLHPLPSLGAPVKPGDPVMIGPAAELTRLHPDVYALTYSAPANVMVEGATDRTRVFLHEADVLYQIRGESSAGAIHFSVQPVESREGRIEFARIP